MGLKSSGRDPFLGDINGGVEVEMLDGAKTVTVYATEDALHRCEPDLPVESLIGVFVRHRDRIEAIATAKYARGETIDAETVIVLAEDLGRG